MDSIQPMDGHHTQDAGAAQSSTRSSSSSKPLIVRYSSKHQATQGGGGGGGGRGGGGREENVIPKLYVANLSRSSTEEDVRSMMEVYGELSQDVFIMRDPMRNSKGVAFVHFIDRKSADDAIAALHEKVKDKDSNAFLVVKYAMTDKDKRDKENKRAMHAGGGGGGQNIASAGGTANFAGFNAAQMQMPYGGMGGMNAQMPYGMGMGGMNMAGMAGMNALTNPQLNQLYPYAASNPYAAMAMQNMGMGMMPGMGGMSGMGMGNMNALGMTGMNMLGYPSMGTAGNNLLNPMGGNAFAPTLPSGGDNKSGAPRGPEGANLFVYGIPGAYTDRDLEQLFVGFGRVVGSKVFKDLNTGKSKGFGKWIYANICYIYICMYTDICVMFLFTVLCVFYN